MDLLREGTILARGTNQKLKLIYLMKIMLEKTDDNHGLTLVEIMQELERYNVTAERKSLYADFEGIFVGRKHLRLFFDMIMRSIIRRRCRKS